MKERLTDFFEDKSVIKKIQVSTFHAFGVSVLKQHFEKTGRKQNFSIINEEDKKQILQKIGIQKSEVNKFSENITEQKQSLQPSDNIEDKMFASVFKKYEDFLIELDSFDFDDLVCETVKLFKEHPDILSGYQNKFNRLLIDEYQDVNFAQYELVRTLMPNPGSNLFVIGDPNQAIYGFRGADVQFIRRFEQDYPEATTYELKKSYRCTDSILKASGNVLAQKNKFLEGIQKGVKIKISENTTDKSEAEFVARTIEQMIGGVGFFSLDSKVVEDDSYEDIESLSDFVILCRVSRQMKTIEKALNDHKIPYQKIGQDPFYRTEPVKSLIDLLKLSLNPDNFLLKERLLKNNIIRKEDIFGLPEKLNNKNLNEQIDFLVNRYFQHTKAGHESLIKILQEIASGYNDIEQFINNLSLKTGIDTWKPGIEAVNLMTLHSVKGLEFNCVFVVGCEDGLLPYSLFEDKKSDIDEERRLLYVGMTRAKKYLYLTHAGKRFLMGKEYQLPRSHFLDKIEKELIEAKKQEYKRKEKKRDDQLELF
jgi:superfamily I DNA/RNA helicase